jgi:hypothetical protein
MLVAILFVFVFVIVFVIVFGLNRNNILRPSSQGNLSNYNSFAYVRLLGSSGVLVGNLSLQSHLVNL